MMSRAIVTRVLPTAAGLLLAAGIAHSQSLSDLAAAAAKKPAVVWYESSPPEQIAKVTAAFNKRFPDIKVQYVRGSAGGGIGAKVIQEAGAGANTASLIVAGGFQLLPLQERGLLLSRDWKALGVDPALVATPYAVAVAGSLGVVVFNPSKVKPDELPSTWSDLATDKWKGRIGTWARGATFAPLAKVDGEPGVRAFVAKLVDMKPLTYASNFQLAQQVAAGEIDIAIGLYHTTLPLLKAGAPVEIKFFDPTPLATIYGAVITKGANPEGAQVLLAWLATPEGALAYEAATGRGNPLIRETETARRVGTHKLVEFGFDEAATLERVDADLTKMLMSAGKPR